MSNYNYIVPPPTIVDREYDLPRLCGPGPCNIWPSVQEAIAKPVISPLCNEYFHVMDDIRAGLQYVFQTKSKLVLAMSGAGHAGMEAVITNLLAPGETLLIASRGMWDERASNIAHRYDETRIKSSPKQDFFAWDETCETNQEQITFFCGPGIKVKVTKVNLHETFSFDQLERALKETRPTALFVTHGDSSTGTVQNIEGLGHLCHKYGALLLVDTVVSLGGVPFLMDEWGVDAVYSATQKALSGPAGISPVAFSAKAEEKIKNRKHEPPFYFDVKLIAPQWNCYGNTRSYHHTMSPPLMWALRACLMEVIKETLAASWDRHNATVQHFHKRLQENGFQFFVPKPEDRLPTVTTVVLPKPYYTEFTQYMRAKHQILIFGGLGPTAGKMLRIGLMGINATKEVADNIIKGMVDTRRALTKSSL